MHRNFSKLEEVCRRFKQTVIIVAVVGYFDALNHEEPDHEALDGETEEPATACIDFGAFLAHGERHLSAEEVLVAEKVYKT